jgi:hypothetical protein
LQRTRTLLEAPDEAQWLEVGSKPTRLKVFGGVMLTGLAIIVLIALGIAAVMVIDISEIGRHK